MAATRRLAHAKERPETILLWLAVAVMAVAAAQRLTDGLACLLLNPRCGVDIRRFAPRVQDWFAGRPVPAASTLPPASYPLLWLLLGWLPLAGALPLWAITSLAALGWLAVIAVRESGAETRAAKLFMALLPGAMYAARGTIVNGQHILHVLPALVAGILLIHRERPAWWRDLLGAALVLIALVKPSVAAPFVLLVALERVRPTLLIGGGYVSLSLLAGAFRPGGPTDLWLTWVRGSVRAAAAQYGRGGAYGSVHDWLGALGLDQGNAAASLLALLALGVWLHRERAADLWIRLGVTAIVARIWTYHRVYDDMLILLPMIALFRLARHTPPPGNRGAGLVLALLWVGALAPARLFFLPPWSAALMAAETITWLVALVFLVVSCTSRTVGCASPSRERSDTVAG